MADLRLSEKLHVIRMIDDGITSQAANQFDVTVRNVILRIQTPKKVELLGKSPTRRNNLSLRDKMRVLYLMYA